MSRWITTDPAGFIDRMNLYGYVKNNPYRYTDPNGLFAFPLIFLPAVFEISFAGIVSWISVEAIIDAVVGATVGIGIYQIDKAINNDGSDIAFNNEAIVEEVETEKGKRKGSDNKTKGGPPRDPKTQDYLPDLAAEGNCHTTFETRNGKSAPYTQGATFDAKGKFSERIDVTNHGRSDHSCPHFPTATSPNSANSPAKPIPGYY